MGKFETGRIVITKRINDSIADNEQFSHDVLKAIAKYSDADWSDMEYKEDINMNDKAVESGEGRIFATYNTCLGKIYIITESDRSVTTILFPDEY